MVEDNPGVAVTVTEIPLLPGPRARMSTDLVRRNFVARQSVHDASNDVVAYKLCFRDLSGESDGEFDHDRSGGFAEAGTSQMIASTFAAFDVRSIAGGRPVFVNFTRAFVTGVISIPIGPDLVVIEIGEDVVPDHELVLGLRSLGEAGYRIALNGYRGDVGHAVLLDLADFVSIDVSSVPAGMLPMLVSSSRECGATLIATGIEDEAALTRCQELGFELFQGAHLQRPSVLEGRTLSPLQMVCVRLLGLLSDDNSPMEQIERLVGTDPGLTMRLLRSANSASSGVKHEIRSLRQAIVLLGPRQIRSWVGLTMLEGGAVRNRIDDLWNVLTRANACQRLVRDERDLAYTIGMLSGCADLLGVELGEVASDAGIGPATRAALVEKVGPAGRALAAVLAHEAGDLDGISATGLMPYEVSRAYLESLSEALQVVNALAED